MMNEADPHRPDNATPEERLAASGLILPEPVTTRFAYTPVLVDGSTVHLAGQLAKLRGDKVLLPGIVGADVTLDEARDVAKICMLQGLAWVRERVGELRRVRQVLRLNGYVRVGPAGFDHMSEVIDAASSVLTCAFGVSGQHVRSVLGVCDLPRHASVMVDLSLALEPDE